MFLAGSSAIAQDYTHFPGASLDRKTLEAQQTVEVLYSNKEYKRCLFIYKNVRTTELQILDQMPYDTEVNNLHFGHLTYDLGRVLIGSPTEAFVLVLCVCAVSTAILLLPLTRSTRHRAYGSIVNQMNEHSIDLLHLKGWQDPDGQTFLDLATCMMLGHVAVGRASGIRAYVLDIVSWKKWWRWSRGPVHQASDR